MIHIIEHTLLDTVKLIPLLFLTYLFMEFFEQRARKNVGILVREARKFGPIIGGILGVVPQCGFSAAASNLFAGRLITVGTLVAIFLSTSDEMIPILLSSDIDKNEIIKILNIKIFVAITVGLIVDLLWKKQLDDPKKEIAKFCACKHCHCEKGMFYSALNHTVKTTLFILGITFLLNIVIHNGGETVLEAVLKEHSILSPFIACVIGLIPNCAASVLITKLYVGGMIEFGAMIAGLLVSSGVGALVLLKENKSKKEALQIISIVFIVGFFSGILLHKMN